MGIFSYHPYRDKRNFYFIEKSEMKFVKSHDSYLNKWEKDFIENLNTNYVEKNKKASEKQKIAFEKIYERLKKQSPLFEDLSFRTILKKLKKCTN